MRRGTLRSISRIVISLGLAMTAWATALDFVDDDAAASQSQEPSIEMNASGAVAANVTPS